MVDAPIERATVEATRRIEQLHVSAGRTMSEQSECNKALVVGCVDVFRTFDPDLCYPIPAVHPTLTAGMHIDQSRNAFKANQRWPGPLPCHWKHRAHRRSCRQRLVGVLLTRHAETNKVKEYEDIHGIFDAVIDAGIHRLELMDFRFTRAKLDLSALQQ